MKKEYRMKKRYLLPIVLFTLLFNTLHSQILHTESFNVIMDSTRVLKGSFSPSFRFRNVRETFLEIENSADISLRFGDHMLTIANKLEYAVYANENILSGGFVYLEYVSLQDKRLAIEPFLQIHWQENTGLDRKYAGGINMRWRLLVNEHTGIFAAVGVLYEYEKWCYSGVSDPALIPPGEEPVKVSRFRGNAYLSLKKQIGDMFDLDLSLYAQPTLTAPLSRHRLAGSVELTCNITQYLGLALQYTNIYDSSPLVPINRTFHDVTLGFTLSF
jgi:hypothetical protein